MEPPAKRLRILQSVEVDETDPDYLAAKQKQQQKLKGTFESIFAKYEGMHESMSDEVSMRTGEVVVDRGHIRREERKLKRAHPRLVDTVLEPALAQAGTSENDGEQAESEDELAPTQVQKRKRDDMGDQSRGALPSKQRGADTVTSPLNVTSTESVQMSAPQVPSTPNPAASLLQHIQFPQTPLGQHAQAAIYATLNQTIAQAVQQAVAPLLSSFFQTTPNLHVAQAPVHPMPSPHPPATDSVKPATDPKWYFPPVSNTKPMQRIEHQRSSPPVLTRALPETGSRVEASSPLVSRRRSPKVHIRTGLDTSKTMRKAQVLQPSSERPESSHSLPALNHTATTCPHTDTPAGDAPSTKTKRMRSTRKYQFTEEDDVHISKMRELHNKPFKDIQASQGKWSGWPISAFQNRWRNHIRHKQLYLQSTPKIGSSLQQRSSAPLEHEEHFFSSKEIPETSSASHRLPTPSSLSQDHIHNEHAIMPSSSHFDDDELELLSLADADITDELPPDADYHHENDAHPSPDEILPSIEGADFRTEDELQLEMLKTEESEDEGPPIPKVLPSTIPETQDSVVVVSPPSQKHKRAHEHQPRPKAIPTHRATSNSDDDLDLIGVDDEPTTPHVTIKRESLTPQASQILCSSPIFKTPRYVPQSSGVTSSGAKSTGRLDRRAMLKEVKHSWTKNKTPVPKSVRKRQSLNVLPTIRKRAWAEVGDSEDELAG